MKHAVIALHNIFIASVLYESLHSSTVTMKKMTPIKSKQSILWLHQSETKGMHRMTNIFKNTEKITTSFWRSTSLIFVSFWRVVIFLKSGHSHTKRWNTEIIFSTAPCDTTLLSLSETGQVWVSQELRRQLMHSEATANTECSQFRTFSLLWRFASR